MKFHFKKHKSALDSLTRKPYRQERAGRPSAVYALAAPSVGVALPHRRLPVQPTASANTCRSATRALKWRSVAAGSAHQNGPMNQRHSCSAAFEAGRRQLRRSFLPADASVCATSSPLISPNYWLVDVFPNVSRWKKSTLII